ncbi:Uncharacterized protein QTN25_002650 [Entamoeba marina]
MDTINDPMQVFSESNNITVKFKLNDVGKNSWVGLYVAKRQSNQKYQSYQYIKNTTDSVVFKNVIDGIYDIRYFTENYCVKYAKRILVGDEIKPINIDILTVDDLERKMEVTFKEDSVKEGDWFGLFRVEEVSHKRPLQTWRIVQGKSHYEIDLNQLKLEPRYYENGRIFTQQYHIRYFKQNCTLYQFSWSPFTFVPSGMSDAIPFGEEVINLCEITSSGGVVNILYFCLFLDFRIEVYKKGETTPFYVVKNTTDKFSGWMEIRMPQEIQDKTVLVVKFVSCISGKCLDVKEFEYQQQ